ncbi:MAG: cytochrome c, partial [Deltaproteobacteria bacterium]|nr:cytochrome c [Deltaproteobacteria bacterium]
MRRGLAVAAGVLALLLAGIYTSSEWQLEQRHELPPEPPWAPPASCSAEAERGARLARLALCITCHGDDLAGTLQSESHLLGRLYSSNLTPGVGGVGSEYEDEDWEHAIRHGVGADGRTLLLMPSHILNGMSNADLWDLIAFLRGLPPVDHQPPATRVGPLLRMGIGLGLSRDMVSSRQIDHSVPHSADVPVREGPSYGEYLVGLAGCRVCHGMELRGSPRPMELLGGPP